MRIINNIEVKTMKKIYTYFICALLALTSGYGKAMEGMKTKQAYKDLVNKALAEPPITKKEAKDLFKRIEAYESKLDEDDKDWKIRLEKSDERWKESIRLIDKKKNEIKNEEIRLERMQYRIIPVATITVVGIFSAIIFMRYSKKSDTNLEQKIAKLSKDQASSNTNS